MSASHSSSSAPPPSSHTSNHPSQHQQQQQQLTTTTTPTTTTTTPQNTHLSSLLSQFLFTNQNTKNSLLHSLNSLDLKKLTNDLVGPNGLRIASAATASSDSTNAQQGPDTQNENQQPPISPKLKKSKIASASTTSFYPTKITKGLHDITANVKSNGFPKRLFSLHLNVLITNDELFDVCWEEGTPIRAYLECPTKKKAKKDENEYMDTDEDEDNFSDQDSGDDSPQSSRKPRNNYLDPSMDESACAIRHSKYSPNLYFTTEKHRKNIFAVLDLQHKRKFNWLPILCREKLVKLAMVPGEAKINLHGARVSQFQIIVHIQKRAILDKVQINHHADLDASMANHPLVVSWQKLFASFLREHKRKKELENGGGGNIKRRRLDESGSFTAAQEEEDNASDTMLLDDDEENDEDEDEDMAEYLVSDDEEMEAMGGGRNRGDAALSSVGGADDARHDVSSGSGQTGEEINTSELLASVTASLDDLEDEFGDELDQMDDEEENSVDVNAFLARINTRTPRGLNSKFTLRGYQQQALRWMVKRELSGVLRSEAKLHPQFRRMTFPDSMEFFYSAQRGILTFDRVPAPPEPPGGILADEMGLGKTLETITVFLSNPGTVNSAARDPQSNCILSNATLVVCPLSLLEQWREEVEKFTSPALSVLCFQGTRRVNDVFEVARHDVVVTTYQTLSKEHSNHMEGVRSYKAGDRSEEALSKLSPLYQIKFHRICLDEAHNIKNRTSLQHKACCSVLAARRWALTGTPIQNHLDDLFSLFSFLQMKPHGEWEWWSRNISRPYQNKNQVAMANLQNVMSNIMLRRTKKKKENGKAIIDLPDKHIHLKELTFSQSEHHLYEILTNSSKDSFQAMQKSKGSNSGESNFSGILELINMLRQLCCHPALLLKSYLNHRKRYIYDLFKKFYDLGPHVYESILPSLPDVIQNRPIDFKKEMKTNWRSSTKLDALCDQIVDLPPGEQAVVFSQWTSLMDLVEIAFEKNGIKFVRLDGSMSRQRRASNMKQFKNDSTIRVGLISLMAGGVGLNLTWASYVFLIDPWWNPAIEAQAIDRVHRMGSKKEVNVVKLAVKDTIEQRVLILQRDKGKVADSLLGDEQGGIDSTGSMLPSAKKKKSAPSKENLKHYGYLLGYNELEELDEEEDEQEEGGGGGGSGLMW